MLESKRRHLLPWIFALGMFVIGTTSLSILGLGPAMTRDLAVSPGAAGLFVTAFAATFAIAAPMAQFALGKRFSPRHLIIAGTIILTAALAWAAVAAGFSSLLWSRIAAALGGALIAPTSAAVAIAMAPAGRRGAVLAIVFTGFTLATVVGVPIMTWLTLLFDWRGAMAVIAVAAFLFLLLVLAVLPNQAAGGDEGRLGEPRRVGYRKTMMILLATLGMLAAQFTIYALMGELLHREFDVTDAGLPVAILLFGIFGVAGNAAAGFLTDRVGADALVWASIVGLAVVLLLMNADLGPVYGTLMLAGCAFAGTLFTTPQQGRLVETVHQEQHAFILALNSSASYLGIACGSGLASLLALHAGLSVLPIAALVVLSFVGAINMLIRVRSR